MYKRQQLFYGFFGEIKALIHTFFGSTGNQNIYAVSVSYTHLEKERGYKLTVLLGRAYSNLAVLGDHKAHGDDDEVDKELILSLIHIYRQPSIRDQLKAAQREALEHQGPEAPKKKAPDRGER